MYSSNILLSSDCVGKLSDFGLACSTEYESDPDESFEESGSISVGTRCYMPPEAFKGRFSTKTDVYSLGVVRQTTYIVCMYSYSGEFISLGAL